MPTYKELRVLADTLVENVTRDSTSWKEFLDSASYTYAYSFANQLLIHGQRPGVTAVATIGIYRLNKREHSFEYTGSTGTKKDARRTMINMVGLLVTEPGYCP